jgi:exonuclease SbcC
MSSVLTLKLQNFRRFVETDVISFLPGLTVISGSNGAGKSTLVESFTYALFGQKRGRGALALALNPRTDNAPGDIQVECELFIDGQPVKIVRSSNSAALWVNSALQVQSISSSLTMANRQISALLGGITREQFESTYVALQGDTAGLVADKAEVRRNIIEKVLQLEVLSRAVQLQLRRCERAESDVLAQGNLICDEQSLTETQRELLRKFQSAHKYEMKVQYIQKFAVAIEQVLEEKSSVAAVAELLAQEARTQVASLVQRQAEHKAVIDRLTLVYQEQERLQASYQGLEKQITKLEGKEQQVIQDIAVYEGEIQKAGAGEQAAEEFAQLQEEIQKCDARLGRLPLIKKCYSMLTAAKDALEKQERQLAPLAHLEEELDQARRQEQQARDEWHALRNNDPTRDEYAEWQRQDSELTLLKTQNEESLHLLKSSAGDARCPTCSQRFTEHTPEDRIEHLTRWLSEELPRRRKALGQLQAGLEERKEAWQREQRQAETKWNRCNAALTYIEKKAQTKETLLASIEEAKVHLHKAEQEWEDLGEKASPDPQEQASLLKSKATLSKRAGEIKADAELYAQLPSLNTYLVKKREEQERLRLDIEQLRNQQATVGYDANTFQAAKDELSAALTEDTNLKNELTNARLADSNAQLVARRASESLERANQQHDRFTEVVEEFQKDERLCSLLENFKKHFFAANTEEVTRRTSRLLLHAITDQSIMDIKFDGDELYYIDASNAQRPISRLSGGEKALVGLCLRIALAEQAQTITKTGKVKFLILDEVLSSLDEERCEAVQRIFEDVQQRGIFEHIIMVTHLDTVKQSWRATGLEVQKVGTKSSKVISVSPGEVHMDSAEELEV